MGVILIRFNRYDMKLFHYHTEKVELLKSKTIHLNLRKIFLILNFQECCDFTVVTNRSMVKN